MAEDLKLWYHVLTMSSRDIAFDIKVLKVSPSFEIWHAQQTKEAGILLGRVITKSSTNVFQENHFIKFIFEDFTHGFTDHLPMILKHSLTIQQDKNTTLNFIYFGIVNNTFWKPL